MTTATKPRPASTELAELQETRDRLHAKVVAAKRKVSAWDEETEAMKKRLTDLINARPEQVEGLEKRVLPGTEAARLSDQIKKRLRSENPHRAPYEKAFTPYEQADRAMQEFKLTRLHDRLAELDPDAERAIDRIREAFVQLRDACGDYGQVILGVRDVVNDTPGLGGQDAGHDPRPEEWRRLAEDALKGEIAKPGLTPTGAARAASHV
jgi:hypothetical protein